MLEQLGQHDAAAAIMAAIEEVLVSGPRTPDMGGSASTSEVGMAIAAALRRPESNANRGEANRISEQAGRTASG